MARELSEEEAHEAKNDDRDEDNNKEDNAVACEHGPERWGVYAAWAIGSNVAFCLVWPF